MCKLKFYLDCVEACVVPETKVLVIGSTTYGCLIEEIIIHYFTLLTSGLQLTHFCPPAALLKGGLI